MNACFFAQLLPVNCLSAPGGSSRHALDDSFETGLLARAPSARVTLLVDCLKWGGERRSQGRGRSPVAEDTGGHTTSRERS